ncbi:MAG: hypothetical protein JXA57_04035 [Armatimonadetes bacterium]|nr:hypothetical protein [Armatimonadota bacterium]
MPTRRPRVGFARVAVTAAGELAGLGVHDELCARVLFAESDGAAFSVIALDHMGLAPAQVASLKAALAEAVGLAPRQIVFFYSHTHAGVDFDTHSLTERLANAMRRARTQARQAQMAYARLDVGRRFSVNRRAVIGHGMGAVSILYNRSVSVDLTRRTEDAGAQIRDLLFGGRHIWQPGYLQPELDPEPAAAAPSPKQKALLAAIPEHFVLDLPVDPHLEWLAFRTPRNRFLGSIIRFAAHPVMWRAGITRTVSADYPGVLCEMIERATGAPALFVNGPCGDIKPLYQRNTEQEKIRVGRGLAEAMLHRGGHLLWHDLTRVAFQRRQHVFRVHEEVKKHAGNWPLDEAAAQRARLANPPSDPVTLKRAMDWELRCWGNDDVGWTRSTIELPFHLVTFNQASLLGLPTEVWSGIGLAIKAAHAKKDLIVGANCDVTTNYVPMSGALADGGYEAVNSMLRDDAGNRFIEIGADLAGSID